MYNSEWKKHWFLSSISLSQWGDFALIMAVKWCTIAVVSQLVEAGADLNLSNKVLLYLAKGVKYCMVKNTLVYVTAHYRLASIVAPT